MRRSFAALIQAGALAVILCAIPANAEQLTREQIIKDINEGFAEKAGGDAPNLVDLLATRFPQDIDVLVDLVRQNSNKHPDPADIRLKIASAFAAIQAREAKRLLAAPSGNLKAVLVAHRNLIRAASASPEFCLLFVGESKAVIPPSREVALLSLVRIHALLTALADGRDIPVAERRAATDDDYAAFAKAAKAKGYDIASWSVLSAGQRDAGSAPSVCAALISSTEAEIDVDGELGDIIRADQASGFLVSDVSVYADAFQKAAPK
jgi:hypothetical protein